MQTISSIAGNIFENEGLHTKIQNFKHSQNYEILKISRIETEKSRLRRKTEKGTDLGIIFESGQKLQHGDVLISDSGKHILVEQMPEKVISISIKEKPINPKNFNELLLRIGHIVGNRHRPISLDKKGKISFPIHSDSELETFKQLFIDINEFLNFELEEIVFFPHKNMNAHEH